MVLHEEEVRRRERAAGVARRRARAAAAAQDDFEDSALAQFIDFAVNKEHWNYTYLAHNAGKFDAILLLEALIKRNIRVVPLFDGNKILMLRIPAYRIVFMDSLKYIKTKLAAFDKRFPDTELCQQAKGTFPYQVGKTFHHQSCLIGLGVFFFPMVFLSFSFYPQFNQEENYEYEGDIPDLSYFVDRFTEDKQVKKIKEYIAEQQGQRWNFKEALYEYLMLDVR